MMIKEWGPPLYVLIRGPFRGSGYQVATLGRVDDLRPAIALVFTTREGAEAYRARKPGGHCDWKIGPLPTWEKAAFFLESIAPGVKQMCLDVERDAEIEAATLSIDEVLAGIREKAAGKGPAAPSAE
jgi:hypothetical protein